MDKNLEVSVGELSHHIGKSFGMYVDMCIGLTEHVKSVLGKRELVPPPYERFKLFTQEIYTVRDMIPFIREDKNDPGDFTTISNGYHMVTGVNITEMENSFSSGGLSLGTSGAFGLNITFGNGTEIPGADTDLGGAITPVNSFFNP